MKSTVKYTEEQLRAEITIILDQLETDHEPMLPQWITHHICHDHVAGLAEPDEGRAFHIAFWEHCGYSNTRKLVTRCINERETPTERPAQPFLPGFPHLRSFYVVTRDGVDVGIPTPQLTVDEILGKAALYRAQSVTLVEHADELERYAGMREQQDAANA